MRLDTPKVFFFSCCGTSLCIPKTLQESHQCSWPLLSWQFNSYLSHQVAHLKSNLEKPAFGLTASLYPLRSRTLSTIDLFPTSCLPLKHVSWLLPTDGIKPNPSMRVDVHDHSRFRALFLPFQDPKHWFMLLTLLGMSWPFGV